MAKGAFIWGSPPPLTPEQRREMSYRNKLYNAVQEGDLGEMRKHWDICRENKIDIAGAILSARDVKTLKLLEELGADIDNPQPVFPFNMLPGKMNILQTACADGYEEVVRYLLAREKADVHIRDIYGRTLLHMSVMEGWSDKRRRPEIVRMLIDKGVDLDAAETERGMTPLMGMVCVSDVESFKMLLDARAAVGIKDKDGKTVDDYIDEFLKGGETKEIAGQMRKLLEAKRAESKLLDSAYVNKVPDPLTSKQKEEIVYWNKLCDAIRAGDADEISKQWNICARKDLKPETATHDVNSVKTLKLLENLGLDVTKKYYSDPYGKLPFKQTIVQSACLNGCVAVVDYLLSKSPSAVNERDEWMGCPLLHAAIAGRSLSFSEDDRSMLVKLLIDRGAAIDAVDKHGETALMAAVLRANDACFKVLIDAGASDAIKNKKEETVDDFLRDLKKREDCVEEAGKMEKILAEKRNQRAKIACTLETLKKADAIFRTSLGAIPAVKNATSLFERNWETNILFARIEVLSGGIASAKEALGDDSPVSPPYVGPWDELKPDIEGWDATKHAVNWAGGKNNDRGNLDATVSVLDGRDVIYIYAAWWHKKMPN